jgi:hypothetical protein
MDPQHWIKHLNSLMRIWDPGWKKFGSWMNVPDPQHCLSVPTLVQRQNFRPPALGATVPELIGGRDPGDGAAHQVNFDQILVTSLQNVTFLTAFFRNQTIYLAHIS